MTKEEADAVLYLVDQLRERGATAVDVAGVRATFASAPVKPAADKPPRKRKTLQERLFGPLGMTPRDEPKPTRQERLKRRPEA